MFKRTAVGLDGGVPGGAAWHIELLASMTKQTPTRPAVISQALADRLKEYMDFRHFFRHAYSLVLRWEKMAPLVADCEPTFRQFKAELEEFLKRIPMQDA